MNVWIEAARPKTLTAAVVPVAVGTASVDIVSAWRAFAALVVSVAIQVAVNYANDLFDAERGVDTTERVGPRRATASGLVTSGQMKIAILVALSVAALAGSSLALAVGPELWLVGALCVLAMFGYSGGPKPYASLGLGEVFVFVFFGLVATVGSSYVQVERIDSLAVAAAVSVGLLAVAILVVNNLRDIATDGPAGKRTLAVRLGDRGTRLLYDAIVIAAFLNLAVVAVVASSPWPLLAAVALPLGVAAVRATHAGAGAALLPALGATARLQLTFGVLLSAGLWAAR